MTERERLVEDVVKAADDLVLRDIAPYPPDDRTKDANELKRTTDALRAHDAAPKPLKWGCVTRQALDGCWDALYGVTYYLANNAGGETNWEQLNCHLTMGHHCTVGEWDTESDALAALDACTEPPPGYVEQMSTTVKTGEVDSAPSDLLAADNARADAKRASEYRLSDDPQATPAGETPSLASRVAELERLVKAMRGDGPCPCKPNAPTATQNVYPCGCISCVCEDEERCHGCGAKSCGRGDRCKAKAPTPSPEPLPFGCVAHQCNDGNWLIRSGDYYWGLGRWEREPRNFAHGAFPTEAKALADFHSTNGGKVPPPDHKPASEGRYEVVPATGERWAIRINVGGLFRYYDPTTDALDCRWRESMGFKDNDIALAVRDALEARNG